MSIVSSYSLDPAKGILAKENLLHLLRRCLFGVGHKEISVFEGKGIDQAMNILLKQSPAEDVFHQQDPERIDPLVPKGRSWTQAPFEDENIDKSRRDALKSWIAGKMITRDYSLTEKMTLFWHNHFVIEMDVVKDSRYSYTYATLVRSHALKNFKQLIKEGTTNPAMMVYLNGNLNIMGAANENYGRELLELFTLGKGHYSEEDVKAAARVLTGWKDNKEEIRVDFYPSLHDSGDKQFSTFFDNTLIKGQTGPDGAKEVGELIDMIFKREEVALSLCRKLYRWFVFHQIDEQVESRIIVPLAKILIENDFEVRPVLKVLLSSQHFFDAAFKGALVKSPVDFFIGSALQFDLTFPKDPVECHLNWAFFYFTMLGLLMGIGDPPSVAGWPAYYQAPKYSQWWINSYTLGIRRMIVNGLSSPEGMACNGPILRFDFIPFIQKLKKFKDVETLIEYCLELSCAVPVGQESKDKLKSILLKNIQKESDWVDLWNQHIADPDASEPRKAIETSLRPFFQTIMNMPEYQVM